MPARDQGPEHRLVLYRGKWAVTWREEGQTRRESLGTVDRADAERRLAEWHGIKKRNRGSSVAELFEVYLRYLDKNAARPDRAHTAWDSLKPVFGGLHPDLITRELCESYTARRRQIGRADGTIRKELEVLRSAIRHSLPASQAVFQYPPPSPPRERYLTRDEFRALLDAARSPHIRLFMVLALATGARKAAILGLTWDRVDMDRRLIQLRDNAAGTRRKGRATVPMTKLAEAELAKAKSAAMTRFVIEYGGESVGDTKKAFERAAERAGLDGVTAHTLRHTAAVWMAEAGVPMQEIASYLGHTNPKITFNTYAKFSPEYLRTAASALEL